MKNHLKNQFLKNLQQVEKELAAYENEDFLYTKLDSIPNSGGNLVHHLAGNIQHFIGATLGNTGYIRKRDDEFNARAGREFLEQYLKAAQEAVVETFDKLDESKLEEEYPIEVFGGQRLPIGEMLIFLLAHFNYHVGQINYHRRLIQNKI